MSSRDRGNRSGQNGLPFSDFVAQVEAGHVEEVTIQGRTIVGQTKDGKRFTTYTPDDPGLVERLRKGGVRINAVPPDDGLSLVSILISWFPMLLLIGVWIFFIAPDAVRRRGAPWASASRRRGC